MPASNSQCWMWIVSNLNWNNKIQIMIGPAASRGRVEKLSVTAASRDSDVFLEMHFHFPHPMCSIHNLGHLHLAFHVIFYCCHLYHSFMFWACSWKLKYDINQSSYKFYQDENEKVWFREFLQCLITVVINVEMFSNCGYFFVWRNIHISIFFQCFHFYVGGINIKWNSW